MRHLVLISATLLGLSGAAQAIEFAQRDPEFPQRDYTCRFQGADVPLGAQRCLATPQGQRTAECGIALNMSSWHASDRPCQ